MITGLTVIIPASNEAGQIGACLAALLGSGPMRSPVQVVVVANGCRDDTAAIARAAIPQADAMSWDMVVIERAAGGKPDALNAGDAAARHPARLYLDADVTVSPGLLPQMAAVLARPAATYASGALRITGQGRIACAYARIWARVPFMAQGVPGCGLFAVNAAGRARWGLFPAIIADDTYVRLHFAPAERIAVPAPYDWPVAEGFAALTRVRRRQDRGVAQIGAQFPNLPLRDGTPPLGLNGLLRLALRDPAGFAVYAGVAAATRLPAPDTGWSRGR